MRPILAILLLLLAACGDGNGGNGGAGAARQHWINWASVPSQFNPQISEVSGDVSGVTKVNVDLFNFTQDVQVVYEKRDKVAVRMYTVWKESASLPSPSVVRRANTLKFDASGSYSCSIDVENGNITGLKGGCIVRVDVVMPMGAQVEVYNVSQLISRRFFPVDNQTFLTDLDNAPFSEQKWAVINAYLQSYVDTKATPILASSEVGKALHGFMRSEEKLEVLSRLHRYVYDRSSLAGMIEQEFMFFDREKARAICGL